MFSSKIIGAEVICNRYIDITKLTETLLIFLLTTRIIFEIFTIVPSFETSTKMSLETVINSFQYMLSRTAEKSKQKLTKCSAL